MYLPILDFSTDKAGNRYDFSLMFLQEHHIKTILGSLLKEKINLEILLESKNAQNIELLQQQHSTISNLVLIISQYKPNKINHDKIF